MIDPKHPVDLLVVLVKKESDGSSSRLVIRVKDYQQNFGSGWADFSSWLKTPPTFPIVPLAETNFALSNVGA